jgi:hypothetical protein
MLITVFTNAQHWFILRATSIDSTPSHLPSQPTSPKWPLPFSFPIDYFYAFSCLFKGCYIYHPSLLIHQWLYSSLLGPGFFFSFVIFFKQTVRLLGRVISPSKGLYINTEQHKHRINAHRHL